MQRNVELEKITTDIEELKGNASNSNKLKADTSLLSEEEKTLSSLANGGKSTADELWRVLERSEVDISRETVATVRKKGKVEELNGKLMQALVN